MYKAEPVGNAAKNSLSQIWNGPAMQAMRKAHARGEAASFRECRECLYPQPRLPLVAAGFLLDPFQCDVIEVASQLRKVHVGFASATGADLVSITNPTEGISATTAPDGIDVLIYPAYLKRGLTHAHFDINTTDPYVPVFQYVVPIRRQVGFDTDLYYQKGQARTQNVRIPEGYEIDSIVNENPEFVLAVVNDYLRCEYVPAADGFVGGFKVEVILKNGEKEVFTMNVLK